MVRILQRRQQENNESHTSIARDLGVDAAQLRRWKKQSAAFNELLANRAGGIRSTATSVHRGHPSCLQAHENALLMFILENRQQGIPVSIRMVTTKACQLDNPPSRERVAGWVVPALQDISANNVRNSWRHRPFSYFEHEQPDGETNDNNDGETNENNDNNEEESNEQVGV